MAPSLLHRETRIDIETGLNLIEMHLVEHRHRLSDTIITIAATLRVHPATNILPQTNEFVELETPLTLCEMLLL